MKKEFWRTMALFLSACLVLTIVSGCIGEEKETPAPTTTAPPETTAPPTTTAPPEEFIDCGKLVYSCYTDIITMDPAEAFVWYSCTIARNCYEGLCEYDLRDYSIKPLLAESWEVSEDNTEWTFYLRKGVKFYDGTEFNAEAVKFNFERIKGVGKGPSTWIKDIKDVQVIDEYTVKFITEGPWAFLLDALAAHRVFLIASPTYVKEHATDEDPWAIEWMHSHTCGTGPYNVVEWVPEQYITLERNENYWKGWKGKHFSKIVYEVNEENTTAVLKLKRGEADIECHLTADFWKELEKEPTLIVKPYESVAQFYVYMNNCHAPLSDKNLRWAITYAVDYDAMVEAANALEQAQGPMPRAMPGHDDTLPIYHRDLDKAREYLNKSSYAGKEVNLVMGYVSTSTLHRDIALIVQSSLADIGINVELQGLTWPTFAGQVYGDPREALDMYTFYASAIIADSY
ncbi:MAG: ABC transporter substrate-binding protein, partial [Candidatus Hodarchaeales archaeon]